MIPYNPQKFVPGMCKIAHNLTLKMKMYDKHNSVNSVVEFPGAGLSRLRTINSELNGAT